MRLRREYRILGPLEVRIDGEPIVVNAGRPRALLAVLLLHPGNTMGLTRLVDAVWGPAPPASADQLMRVYVSQLRKAIGDDAILTRAPGYALALDGAEVDSLDFRRLVEEADRLRAENAEEGLKRYEDALRLWRGDVLADTPVEADAAAAVRELNDLRVHALEERFELEVRGGRHDTVIPELERVVAAHPLRERLVEQLMLALYRSGRQADALAVYQEMHRLLGDELGLTPTPRLRQLQQDILRQEAQLDPPLPRAEPRRRRRFWGLVAAGVAVVGVAVVVAVLRVSGHAQLTIEPNSLVELDVRTGKPDRELPLAGIPGRLVVAGRRLWVVDTAKRTLSEVEAANFHLRSTIGLSALPHELVFDGHTIWVANGFAGTLSRLAAGTMSPPFRAEPGSTGRIALAFGAGSIWAGSQDGAVARLDAANGRPVAIVRDVHAPEAIAVTSRAAWVAQATSVDLVKIDVQTNQIVRRIPLGGIPEAVATSGGSVWALTPGEGALWRIDARTSSVVARVPIAPNASAVLATRGGIWVASESSGTLTRIDLRRNAATETVSLGLPLGGVATDGTELFLTTR